MKNDYKMLYCQKCGCQQQHFEHWKCREYTICLGCSISGRKGNCTFCSDMQVKMDIALKEIKALSEFENIKASNSYDEYARRLVKKEITIDDVSILLKREREAANDIILSTEVVMTSKEVENYDYRSRKINEYYNKKRRN